MDFESYRIPVETYVASSPMMGSAEIALRAPHNGCWQGGVGLLQRFCDEEPLKSLLKRMRRRLRVRRMAILKRGV